MKSWSFLALCGCESLNHIQSFHQLTPRSTDVNDSLVFGICSNLASYCHNEYPEHLPRLNGVAKVFEVASFMQLHQLQSWNIRKSWSGDSALNIFLGRITSPFQLNGWPIRKGRWTYDCWVSSPEPQEESKPFPCHGPLYLVILKSGTDIITKKHQKNWSQSSM